MDLNNQVLHAIVKKKLFQKGDALVVGVSGGADSVALIHVLNYLKHPLGIKIHIAHFNHRLRPTADRDEKFVSQLASKLNLPLTIHRRKSILKGKIVSEDTARQWRFTFFSKVLRQNKAQAIVLAHTQNDLAETVLMRLLRGSGLLGLRGILAENRIEGERFVRPFLSVQRIQIEKYLKENHLQYCNDETNQQTHYLRNKVRLKLLPDLIKNYNPNLPNILVDLAYTSQEDYSYLFKQAEGLFKKNVNVSNTKIKIKLEFFQKQHVSMQRMLLRLSFEKLVSNVNQLSFTHIQEVEDMLVNRFVGSLVHWPQKVSVLKSESELIINLKSNP